MYFGSVRFFKHFIIAVIILLICGLSVSTICLAIMNGNYRDQIAEIQSGIVLAQANPKEEEPQNSPSIAYQALYPDLYAKPAKSTKTVPNTVYLTFDDGPSGRTSEILDILKKENIKATFFVIGKEGEKEPEIMRRIVEEGHTLGIHTYSHVYTSVYDSVESYLEDFNRTYELIYEATGLKTEIFRFPGGSINKYNALFYEEIIAEMTRRGFTYYDWNSSNGDAASNATAASVYNNTIRSSEKKDRVILLMHDSAAKYYTVAALPGIIEYYKGRGMQFEALTNDVSPIAFNYINYE
ncbi:MAG: polysaccharide deacetylase [Bacillota bacterium]|nr:polysaccharide deacetylase [Bacillota bacterium]